MRTAKEIFKSKYPYGHLTFMNVCIELINEARKEAIEECAKRAKMVRYTINPYEEKQHIIASTQGDTIDKESILSIIKELK